jgi:DHA1 family multidrug resistance protein-like MFS transporter
LASTWRRNLFAVTSASFIGFTGFTLVMPFLPLFIRELGVSDVGEIALWTGAILGVTPAVTAAMSPFWGRLADRYGRKIMVARSLVSCAAIMGAMAFVTQPWHVFALRALLGLLTGYGGLTLTMAAESAPRDRMAQAIGTVQTAQRLGPAIGPVLGGVLAGIVGLRPAFLVTAGFYATALVLVLALYDERGFGRHASHHAGDSGAADHPRPPAPLTFRSVMAFENFVLLMAVIFGIQFVDRSFGPILPLYIERIGVTSARVPLAAGMIFSLGAVSGAAGHHFCGGLLGRFTARIVISGSAAIAGAGAALFAVGGNLWLMTLASILFGTGVGAATTAAYTAAGAVIPSGAHGTGFGLLSSASLAGLAVSPVVAGFLGASTLRGVFVLDVLLMGVMALAVRRLMVESPNATISTRQASNTPDEL